MNNNQFRLNQWLQSPSRQILLILFVIVGLYLITAHTSHVFDTLPYLLLVLCPLMHLFMHGGHGDHDRHSSPSHRDKQSNSPQNQGDSGSDHLQGHIH